MANRQISVTNPAGETHSTSYNANGKVIAEMQPLGLVTTTTRDPLDLVIAVMNPASERTTTLYDEVNQLVATFDPLGNCTTFIHDAARQRIAVRDALDRATTAVYDARGLVFATIDPFGNWTENLYDALGQKILTAREQELVASDTFAGGLGAWTEQSGHWEISGGHLQPTSTTTTSAILLNVSDPGTSNCVVEADVSGDAGATLGVVALFQTGSGTYQALELTLGSTSSTLAFVGGSSDSATVIAAPGVSHNLRLSLLAGVLTGYLDGLPVLCPVRARRASTSIGPAAASLVTSPVSG